MIRFEHVTITYDDAPSADAARRRPRRSPRASSASSSGRTGSGKSTLLGAINGLVPHFTGGTLPGGSPSTGATPRTHPPRELADVVGVVGQDPLAGFVTDTVEEELAYGMEQLGVPPAGDAQAGGGDARPARPRRPARPAAAPAVGRPAAAGRDRRGADRAPARPRARRADLRARPDRAPRRCWPPSPGSCTTSASPW